jgi:hypothetical protein
MSLFMLTERVDPNEMDKLTVLSAMCAILDGIRASLMDPQALFSQPCGKIKTSPVIWDSGAFLSLSFDRDDFVGELKTPSAKYKQKGIAKGLDIEGVGHVVFTICNCTGMLRSLKTKALYCPKLLLNSSAPHPCYRNMMNLYRSPQIS